MIRIKVCVQLFWFFLILQSTKSNEEDYEVELVQVVFRHGDRTPTKSELYKNLAYNPIYDSLGYGQLTDAGKIREFRLGAILRKRYRAFLGDHHKYGSVYAYSSDIDRTKMSLQLVLGGLYPPILNEMGHLELSPIATHYVPLILDNLMFPMLCPAYLKEYIQTKVSSSVRAIVSKNKELFQYLANYTGSDMILDPIFSTYKLHHFLTTQESMNITLPEWATKDVERKMNSLVKLEYDLQSHNTAMKRLNGGFLVKEFIKNMDAKKTRNSPKIYVYSGHEVNVAAFARAHDLTQPEMPFFGSTIIVEKLRNCAGKQFVRMLHWSGTEDKLFTYTIPNCGEICPYEKYVRHMKRVIPSDEESDCLWNNVSLRKLRRYYTGLLDLITK
ncbi:venom acid phosphatase Acph-1 [Bombus terrestris]|uniref:acid phosphatase n=1 Tax=Bombus terrestris TaxID=30195 RepID=A0A9B0BUL5_BOMTE|nr:venom acid phosphatase Acph-1 [Bombus terrestris]